LSTKKELTMSNIIELSGRILLAVMFVLSGFNKIGGYAGTQAYMESQDVPGMLLPLVILLEIVAPVLLVIGWQTRIAALGLAAFSLLTALLFHMNFSDQTQMIMFMKNITIAGGLVLLAAHGAGALSLDHRRASEAIVYRRYLKNDPQSQSRLSRA
jgi:putative oxidoreductase